MPFPIFPVLHIVCASIFWALNLSLQKSLLNASNNRYFNRITFREQVALSILHPYPLCCFDRCRYGFMVSRGWWMPIGRRRPFINNVVKIFWDRNNKIKIGVSWFQYMQLAISIDSHLVVCPRYCSLSRRFAYSINAFFSQDVNFIRDLIYGVASSTRPFLRQRKNCVKDKQNTPFSRRNSRNFWCENEENTVRLYLFAHLVSM